MGEHPDALDLATERRALRDWLQRKIITMADEISRARGQVEQAQADHALQDADVQRHERITLTRVLTTLRGVRTGELARERAEADAALLNLDRARDRLNGLLSEREALRTRLEDLADVEAEYDRAVRVRTARLARLGAPQVHEIDAISEQLESLPLTRVELHEAISVGVEVNALLGRALRSLDSARTWSGIDMWVSGGFLASAAKYQHIDTAEDVMRSLTSTLARFRTELADVSEVLPPSTLEISGTLRGFDVWFDDIFADFTVHRRINAARERVLDVQQSVGGVLDALEHMVREVRTREHALRYDRDQLLRAAGETVAPTTPR